MDLPPCVHLANVAPSSATRCPSFAVMARCLLMMLYVMGYIWDMDTAFSEDIIVVVHLRV